MSNVTELLLEKAASLHQRADELEAISSAESVESIDEPVNENSWAQVKQAAVTKLVEQMDMDEDTASSLLDTLEENFNA